MACQEMIHHLQRPNMTLPRQDRALSNINLDVQAALFDEQKKALSALEEDVIELEKKHRNAQQIIERKDFTEAEIETILRRLKKCNRCSGDRRGRLCCRRGRTTDWRPCCRFCSSSQPLPIQKLLDGCGYSMASRRRDWCNDSENLQ